MIPGNPTQNPHINLAQSSQALPPVESVGHCRNAHRCREYDAILGDGLCQRCWDMTQETPAETETTTDRRSRDAELRERTRPG